MTIQDEEAAISGNGYKSFEDEMIRRSFIRKVFAIVSAQFTIALACVLMTTLVDRVRDYLVSEDNLGLTIGILVASSIAYITSALLVYLVLGLSKRYPANFILLFVITVASSIMVSIICTAFKVEAVIIALGITILCCTGIFFFTFNTKFELHTWQGLLCFLIWVLLITAALIPVPYSSALPKIYAGVAALVLMLILIADLFRICDSDSGLSPEEYVLGALQVYSDIIIFFLLILALVAALMAAPCAVDSDDCDCDCRNGNDCDCDCDCDCGGNDCGCCNCFGRQASSDSCCSGCCSSKRWEDKRNSQVEPETVPMQASSTAAAVSGSVQTQEPVKFPLREL